MLIRVKTLTGKEISLNVEPTDTGLDVKNKVSEKEGIPPTQQRLISGGQQMGDKDTCKSKGIMPGHTLHLVLALRGGVA